LTLCAECSLVSHLVGTGGTRLVAVCTVAGDGAPIAPCGRCRQVLFEFGGADLLIDTDAGPVTLGELLPWAFGPDDVVTRRDPA
jgi:cytidine deaminase